MTSVVSELKSILDVEENAQNTFNSNLSFLKKKLEERVQTLESIKNPTIYDASVKPNTKNKKQNIQEPEIKKNKQNMKIPKNPDKLL